MDSLIDYNKNVSRYVFVVRAEDNASEFIKTHCAAYGIHDVKIVEPDHMTDGQATTCMLAIPYCDEDDAIMVYNIDTYVESNEMKYEDISGDGHIPGFHADGDHWSFVRLDSNGKAVEVREKKRISDNCTLVLIISLQQNCTRNFMKNTIQMIPIWRKMRSILHRFIIL